MRTELGKLIATERIKRDITQKEMASALNVSVQYLSFVEHGVKALSTQRAISILAILKGINEREFWRCYFRSVHKINIKHLPKHKRDLIATIMATDIDKHTAEAMEETIYGLS